MPDDRAQRPTHAREKKPDSGVHAASQHLYEAPEQAKLIYTDGNKASGCLGWGWGKVPDKRHRGTFWGLDMFCTLTQVVVTR